MNRRPEILIVSLSNIGDVILTTPVITSLKDKFPDSRMTLVVGPRARGVVEGSRFIDRLVVYDKQASWSRKIEYVRQLREVNYDYVVDLRNSLVPFLVKTQKRSPVIRRFKKNSIKDRHLEILERMGLGPLKQIPFDFYHPEDWDEITQKLRRRRVDLNGGFAVIAPVAASGLKTWKIEGFKKVIEKLLRETKMTFLLAGAEREKNFLEPLAALNPLRVHNLAGETGLKHLAALIDHSEFVLANDSSVMHLALEQKCRVAAVFGPTDPEKSGQKSEKFHAVRENISCSPCERSTCRFSRQACFEDLSPEKVFDACRELIHAEVH
jgi:ADP-heptose:LPS heptosyltransferase